MSKHTHETNANVAGRMNAVALCGRLVGRLSLSSGPAVTCPGCRAKRPPLVEGQQVTYSGFEGRVMKVHTGQLAGMVDVRLPGGLVCVDALDCIAVPQRTLAELEGVRLGDMTPAERRAVTAAAMGRLKTEIEAKAPAIQEVLRRFDSEGR
jgi:hypothetical protein